MIAIDAKERAVRLVLQILSQEESITTEIIQITVRDIVELLHKRSQAGLENIDYDQLVREIETLCDVYVPEVSTLDDNHDHRIWLNARRAEIQWRFWDRYLRYLEDEVRMPPQAIWRLNEVTDQILGRLENPQRSGSWDRRGMVVGQVQSGKTSNYAALICKAADAGYKLIVVLAGIHNSLRSQTQLRLDEGFLGFDTQQRNLFDPDNIRLGVGRLPGTKLYHVHSLTNSLEKGDFNLKVARQANVMIGGADPVLLVVKKNASVLKNLLKWSTILQSSDQGNVQSQVHGVPLLLIDDEADNASINTNPFLDENGQPDPEIDPSKINGLIRKLLNSFAQSAYIGYTATPFANIFIADKTRNEKFGEDLFPRSFIMNLQPPSNYLGPAKLFGLINDHGNASAISAGLPLIRRVSDYLKWTPDKHKKEHKPETLPETVKEAIKAFMLACAIRHARGQARRHNSMLIHVTRFTAVQTCVFEQVKAEVSFYLQRLRYSDGLAPEQIMDEFKALWDTDFVPTMQQFHESDLIPVTWDQVKEVLYLAASKIEVRKINGTANDTLQYVEHPQGLSVICIGGDKLSRGLTLEGLSISYYLRASKMYDTLMQMGRWFGYRIGYADVCRLYTTSELADWYRDITTADEELREMFEDMAAQEKTPEDYGLRVRKHPGGLMITAAAKMRHGQKAMISYAHTIVETIVFSGNETVNKRNWLATEQLIQDIADKYTRQSDAERGNYVWNGVDGEAIVDFLTAYSTHETARKVQSSVLIKYIKACMAENELVEWTVVLISNQEKVKRIEESCCIANLTIGLTERREISNSEPSDSKYSIRRLLSPSDEWIDFAHDECPEIPSGPVIRRLRPAQRGLLLLYMLNITFGERKKDELKSVIEDKARPTVGFAISFPGSSNPEKTAVEYMVNNIYWEQEFGGEG